MVKKPHTESYSTAVAEIDLGILNSPYSLKRANLDAQQLLKHNINHSTADRSCLKAVEICKFSK